MAPPPASAEMQASQTKQYVVEMKMVECHEGEKDRSAVLPKLTVLANEPAAVSCGRSHASLWEKGVPANDMGHEGIQIGVTVSPDQNNRVRLDCSVWMSVPDEGGVEHFDESRCQCAQLVKLGEMAKVCCDRLIGHSPVRCRLELTVKESPEEKIAPQTADATVGCGEVCEQPRVQVGDVCVPFQGCHMVVTQVAHTAPVCPAGTGACKSMTITTVEVPCKETGKQGDLCGPAHELEMCCSGAKMTCARTELKLPGYETLKFHCEEDHVFVTGGNFKASADKVILEKSKLIFQGHVKIVSSKETVDVEAGKATLEMKRLVEEEIIQTGVISNPSLIQN